MSTTMTGPRASQIVLLFIGSFVLANKVASASGVGACTQSLAVSIGCDEILDVATYGGGHPDYFLLGDSSSVTTSFAGQTLCIPAGNYSALSLRYIEGTSSSPITIINCGGRVVFDGRDSGASGDKHWSTISAKGSRYIHLTGAGDPSVEFGIVAHDSASHGVHFDEGCSDIEVDHVETHSNHYAGITIRTYPRCDGRCGHVSTSPSYSRFCNRGNFTQYNTVLHHNYVHDTPGEGFYVGTSHFHLDETASVYDPGVSCAGETQAQPELDGVRIYDNVVEDTGMDGIQVGAATRNVAVYRNVIRRWAYVQKYGDANAIGMNPGSTGDVYDNWLEGRIRSAGDSEEYFGIVFYGQGADDQSSKIYNNVILNVNNAFMFMNREEASGQELEFAHNTVHNFTGTGPVKLYCLSTVTDEVHPFANVTVRNNIFADGANAEIYDQYGFKKFYGNTNGIIGMECMDVQDAYDNNHYSLDDPSLVQFADPTNLDFRLLDSSPARDQGVALVNGPRPDYNGVSRGDPPDHGAYESWPEAAAADLPLNPERGFYHHTESHASSPAPLDLSYLQGIRSGGRTVILRVYYLDDFMDTDNITQVFLDQLAADFQTMLDAGIKCVIRFAYYRPSSWPDASCCDGGTLPSGVSTCCTTEPQTSRILAHVSTLATVLQSWIHAIVAVQSGLIGPWGEGHSSTNFRCSAKDGDKKDIVEALLSAVPGRDVQLRYPKTKPNLYYADQEASMTTIAANLFVNAGFETADGGSATGAASWSIGVGSSASLETTDSVSGSNSIRVDAGSSAAQYPSLSAAQGAPGNVIKIYGHSKLVNAPADLPLESDYSIYADISFTSGDPLYGKAASFCGSGSWEYAGTWLEVPAGRTISSMSVHLMYRNVASGYALFDDVGIAVFDPHSIAVSSSNALDGSNFTRVGHHNDCFLASDTDWGTYDTTNIDGEKDFIEADTLYTSMGGETCANNPPRSDCTTAMEELGRFHYTYLNRDYHLDVINGWDTGGCIDAISSNLGYKIVITSSQISPSEFVPGGDVSYSITFENRGYARPLHDRKFGLRFVSSDLECFMEDSSVDIRTWYPSDSTAYTVTGVARFPYTMTDGSYNVYLDLADAHGDLAGNILFKTGFANEGLFNDTAGLNDLRQTIVVNSNVGLSTGTSASFNTVSCGNFVSNWSTETERVLDSAYEVDPQDSRVTMRGSGQLTFGKGIAKFNGSPRMYISPEDASIGFDNVEFTAYGKFAALGTPVSYSGLTMATRSKHDNYSNDPCDAFGYYARIYQNSGECSFQKEYYHSTSTGTIYSATNRVDCFGGEPLPLNQWIGLKFKVTTVPGTYDVLLELYLDVEDNGNWQLRHSLTDTPGSWNPSGGNTVPSECPQSDGDTVVRPGTASFLRSDGSTETEVHWRDVYLMNSPSTVTTSSPTSNPTSSPTGSPTGQPTGTPSHSPTTSSPTANPTSSPSESPTKNPTGAPSQSPVTSAPTTNPTSSPSANPSKNPTGTPSDSPDTGSPTGSPNKSPTGAPSKEPTSAPSKSPVTPEPTDNPSKYPSDSPTTGAPSKSPVTPEPTDNPTTPFPTSGPTTGAPSQKPTEPLNPSFDTKVACKTTFKGASCRSSSQAELDSFKGAFASLIEVTSCTSPPPGATGCSVIVKSLRCSASGRLRSRERQLQSTGNDEIIVEFEIVLKAICTTSECLDSNVQDIANTLYNTVTDELRAIIKNGSLVSSLKAVSGDISDLLDQAIATGDFSDIIVPILEFLMEWYPDWSGRSGTCLNDGRYPYYMYYMGGYFETSLDACCQRYFGYDMYTCTGDSEILPNGYFPNWETTEIKCLASNDKMPDYMRSGSWLKSDVESCCKTYYTWAYNDCIEGSGGTPSTSSTGMWYVDWSIEKCVKDCVDSLDSDCGGYAYNWDTLYSTASTCCDTIRYVERSECTH